MAVSGVTIFNQTLQQISLDAMCLLGVYNYGDTVNANDYTLCSNFINKMVKAWEGQGIHLWTANEGATFLTVGQQSYTMASTDTDVSGDSPIYNQLTSNAAGNTVIVTATAGIKVNDNVGVVLDAGTIYWNTVNAVNNTTNTITMNGSIPSPASSGQSVFSFTNRIDRPLHLTNARYYTAGGAERPIKILGRTEFMYLPVKANTGAITQVFYAPGVSDSTLYTWQCAFTSNDCIKYSYIRRIDDFVLSTDNPDLPQEWLECITYNLAVRIAPAFGIATAKLNPDITAVAQQSLTDMALWDSEEGGLRINNNYRWDWE